MSYNDDSETLVLDKFGDMIDPSKNIFYNLFEYPEGLSEKSFVEGSPIRLSFPTNLPLYLLPPCLKNYPSMFPSSVHDESIDVNFTSFRKFYSDPLLPEIRLAYSQQIQKNLQFRSEIQQEIQKDLAVIQTLQNEGKKILGVFLRYTEHYNTSPFAFDDILQEVNRYAKDYDFILISTQVEPMLKRFQNEFGEKVISFSRKRLDSDIDWKKNVSDIEFEEEVKMAIIDCYLMSQCNYLLSGVSNMLLLSLFFNPTIPFSLFETIKTDVSL